MAALTRPGQVYHNVMKFITMTISFLDIKTAYYPFKNVMCNQGWRQGIFHRGQEGADFRKIRGEGVTSKTYQF